MGWFDEQIRERKEADQEAFEETFRQIAGAILGRSMGDALNQDREAAADAVGCEQ